MQQLESIGIAGSAIVPAMLNAAAKAKMVIHPVRRNISVLEGSGGNIAVLTGKDGKLLVDAGFAVSRPAIASALTSINADSIAHLINTHWHTDHTDGNAWLHGAGAAITAHENTRKRLSVATRVEGWSWTFPAGPAGALPATVFAAGHELHLNDTRIVLKYYGPAHTDSTSRSTSPTPMSSMSAIPGGTESTPSSTTPRAAASMARSGRSRPISQRSPTRPSSSRDTDRLAADPMSLSSATCW